MLFGEGIRDFLIDFIRNPHEGEIKKNGDAQPLSEFRSTRFFFIFALFY